MTIPSKDESPTTLAIDPKDYALGGNVVGGDPNTYHPALWDFLIREFAIRSVLDVGCGEGHCVRYFRRVGVQATGIDGLRANREHCVTPIVIHDIRAAPFSLDVDLVHCCEVVEHIEEFYIDNLLETLTCGRILAMTHGLPSVPGGHHHVNCQKPDYWISRIELLGYKLLLEATARAKDVIMASGKWSYFLQSGLIFERIDV